MCDKRVLGSPVSGRCQLSRMTVCCVNDAGHSGESYSIRFGGLGNRAVDQWHLPRCVLYEKIVTAPRNNDWKTQRLLIPPKELTLKI